MPLAYNGDTAESRYAKTLPPTVWTPSFCMSWFRACSCVVLSFTFCAVQLLGCGAEASSDRISQVTGQLHLLDHQEPPAGVSPEVKRVLLERCAVGLLDRMLLCFTCQSH